MVLPFFLSPAVVGACYPPISRPEIQYWDNPLNGGLDINWSKNSSPFASPGNLGCFLGLQTDSGNFAVQIFLDGDNDPFVFLQKDPNEFVDFYNNIDFYLFNEIFVDPYLLGFLDFSDPDLVGLPVSDEPVTPPPATTIPEKPTSPLALVGFIGIVALVTRRRATK
ncbi:MAG: hypothetical protein ACK5O1_01180 [Holosporales bacterium]